MLRVFAISCCLVSVVAAALPAGESMSERYSELWLNSPFTSPAEKGVPVDEPLFDGYALGGVSEFADGYFVVLIDKKTLKRRVVSRPGTSGGIRVAGVNRPDHGWRETTVLLTDGKLTSAMKFDESLFRRISEAQGAAAVRHPSTPPASTKSARPRHLKSSR